MGILLIILVVGLAVWLLTKDRENEHGFAGNNTVGPETALELLRKRYARGEIDRAEFEACKRDLL